MNKENTKKQGQPPISNKFVADGCEQFGQGDLLAACKALLETADKCFGSILETGHIRAGLGTPYRKAKEAARKAINKAEGRE